MSDNVEFKFDILHIMIKDWQDDFITGSNIMLKNIIKKTAQDNFEQTFYIKNCFNLHHVKLNELIEIIDQKYYINSNLVVCNVCMETLTLLCSFGLFCVRPCLERPRLGISEVLVNTSADRTCRSQGIAVDHSALRD